MKHIYWTITPLICMLSLFMNDAVYATQNNNLTVSETSQPHKDNYHYFYVGPSIGYASTDWSFLVTENCQYYIGDICIPNSARYSAPIGAQDDGMDFGVLFGYRFSKNFALESQYAYFHKSTIELSEDNFEVTEGKSGTTFDSKTEALTFQAKFILPESVWKLQELEFYSTLGLEVTHRNDILANKYNVGGVFGAGLMYNINDRFAADLYFNYYTGYGASTVYPCEEYIPFIYQINTALLIKL